MKIKKTSGHANYGMIPHNEYTAVNTAKNTGSTAPSGYDPQPDDAAYKQRLIKRQAQHPAGRRKVYGWSRLWKANGWRAESAALQNELTGMRRYYGYV